MSYFKEFPQIPARFNDTNDTTSAVDVFVRFKIIDLIRENSAIFFNYTWRDIDRPDTVAHKYYGDSRYYWLIFLSNGSFDYFYDFPLSNRDFDSFINEKYGSFVEAQRQLHHFEQKSTGFIIDYDTYLSLDVSDRLEVSAYDYESRNNEDRRKMKLLSRRQLSQILNEYQDKMKAIRNG